MKTAFLKNFKPYEPFPDIKSFITSLNIEDILMNKMYYDYTFYR